MKSYKRQHSVSERIVFIEKGVTIHPQWRLAKPVDFEMFSGEHIAIVGDNGSGKTLLADIIAGRHPLVGNKAIVSFPLDAVSYITFRDVYGGDAERTFYLQQRWNQTEIDDSMPTVREALERESVLMGIDIPHATSQSEHEQLYDILSLTPLLDKPLVLLSSGELRKFQLAKRLIRKPRLLIIDNPFIGLDEPSRLMVAHLLERLASHSSPLAPHSTSIILILPRTSEIPSFVTHVVEVRNQEVLPKVPAIHFHKEENEESSSSSPSLETPFCLNDHSPHSSLQTIAPDKVLNFNDVTVKYGSRTILSHLNWHVARGERWAIRGPNGSGKSTLLALVCADNPQGYACDIRIFGRKMGPGRSIWDIKQRIGYVSPEMHRAYRKPLNVERVVESGFNDTIGVYRPATPEQSEICRHWMNIFGIDNLRGHSFLNISSGEQRMALLARAFVKEPELLILDEPFHGLDDTNRQKVRAIIVDYCQRPDITLLMVSHETDDFPPCITHLLRLGE